MQPFFTYLLRCRDGSFYVGHTDDLERRVAEHETGAYGGHTSRKRPVKLVWAAEFDTREEALERELQLKRWSRAKKDALVREDWDGLKGLARGLDRSERDHPRPSTPGPLRGPYAQGERGGEAGPAQARPSTPGPLRGPYAQDERGSDSHD